MMGSIMKFLISGVIWLFIFSYPIDDSKKVFDLGYEYIVHSKPVKQITPYLSSIFTK